MSAKLIIYFFDHELISLSLLIFLVGLLGFLTSLDFLDSLINIEIMMLGLNFYLITGSWLVGSAAGQFFALCFLALTAAETAIGLGFLVLLFRIRGRISFVAPTDDRFKIAYKHE